MLQFGQNADKTGRVNVSLFSPQPELYVDTLTTVLNLSGLLPAERDATGQRCDCFFLMYVFIYHLGY
jgi:hypothetical protein